MISSEKTTWLGIDSLSYYLFYPVGSVLRDGSKNNDVTNKKTYKSEHNVNSFHFDRLLLLIIK